MEFRSRNIYHIYNRGNNKQSIFFSDRNYIYFLQKVRKYILPHCDILCYVLMPNHFHFLIHADERTEMASKNSRIVTNVLSDGIRLLLSAYTKGINKQENRTGNLIQQRTKIKCVFDASDRTNNGYTDVCFHYIHQNPLRAGFTNKMEDWHYSSYRDYIGLRKGTLCNQLLTFEKLGFNKEQVSINKILSEDSLRNIW